MESLLRLDRGASRGPAVAFPLPIGALPDVKVSAKESAEYRAMAASIIDWTVDKEREYYSDSCSSLAGGNWKLVNEKEGLRVYKRAVRASGATEQAARPMVLCVGYMQGTIEEVLHGLYGSTTDEERAVSALLSKNHMDAAVLDVMDRGTKSDPLRLLALKWHMDATPGGDLIKNRDMVTLESMGIAADARGKRFGHILLKSVERPELPHFSKDVAVRSTLAFCFVLRQATPDTVGVFAKGVLDLGGGMPDWLRYNLAFARLSGILRSSKSQMAKQLTALALRTARQRSPPSSTKVALPFADKCDLGSDCADHRDDTAPASGDDRDPSGRTPAPLRLEAPATTRRRADCALCKKASGMLWVRSSPRPCQVCNRVVCTKCAVKKRLLSTPTNVWAWCCKGCVLEARGLPVDPCVLCPLLQPN